MDQTKIGKLIASLRKEKGMTQRELGDKVGVGFKAVSKWERGITCPDISIINELSKILGITSDELLTGELNKEHTTTNKTNKKFNKKILLILIPIVLVLITILTIYKYNNVKTDIYNLDSLSNEYYINGKIVFKNDRIYININDLRFINKDFNNLLVKNYMYHINYDNHNLVSFGYLLEVGELSHLYRVLDIIEDFNVNYENTINIDKKEIINNGLVLVISFLDEKDNLIEKEIILTLNKNK